MTILLMNVIHQEADDEMLSAREPRVRFSFSVSFLNTQLLKHFFRAERAMATRVVNTEVTKVTRERVVRVRVAHPQPRPPLLQL